MEPQAVAIRLPKLDKGPEGLKGEHPIVIFTDQGMAGASPGEKVLAAGGDLNVGGFGDLNLPDRSDFADRRPAPTQKFQIDDIVVILDRSGSMRDPVSRQDNTIKLEHIRQALRKMGTDFFPQSNISLIVFNSSARQLQLPGNDLNRAISSLSAEGGTNFKNAFSTAEPIVAGHRNGHSSGRKVVLFLSDGQDGYDRQGAKDLARMIRNENAAAFLIGVGADYEQANFVELAGKFGFACWGHTPAKGKNTVFNFHLPNFLAEVQSAEHYLKLKADGVSAFFGITPAIREADQGVVYVGYQNNSVSVCFANEDDPELTLEVSESVCGADVTEHDIRIYDYDQAAAYFEEQQRAKEAIGPLLVLLAQLNKDCSVLENLRDSLPQHSARIDSIIDDMSRPHDDASRANLHETIADFGTECSTVFFDRQRAQSVPGAAETLLGSAASAESGRQAAAPNDPGQTPNGDAGNAASGELHSGFLGPLEQDPNTVGPLRAPNPEAYQSVIPENHSKLLIEIPDGKQEFDLHDLRDGDALIAGSKEGVCKLRIAAPGVADVHMMIFRKGNQFSIRPAMPRLEILVNDQTLDMTARLQDGDRIQIGQAVLTFVQGKK